MSVSGQSGTGSLRAIWIQRAKRGPMDPVDRARAESDRGLVGNAKQGGYRQVTLIQEETWSRVCEQLGREVDPVGRRANLMISGVSLDESRNQILQVGELRIRILGETRPCERMDEAQPGLQEALKESWAGGAFGVVLNDAEIRVGDRVAWES